MAIRQGAATTMRRGRLPEPRGDLHLDAVAELRWAMGGAGLTPDKAAEMRAVPDLPAIRNGLLGVPADSAAIWICERIAAAARNLGDGVHARLLRTSLAVDYAGQAKDLTGRRLEFVESHNAGVRARGGRDYLGETMRAAYDAEHRMLVSLVTALGAPASRSPGRPVPPARPDPWRLDRVEATCRFRGRALRASEVVETLVARDDGLEEYRRMFSCDEEGGSPARLVMLDGGELVEERSVGRPNFRVATIRLPRPLAANESHRLRFDIRYPGRRSSEPFIALHVARPLRRFDLRLVFDLAERPARLWAFGDMPPGCRGGDPDDGRPLTPNRLATVDVSYDEPTIGLQYGVAWSW